MSRKSDQKPKAATKQSTVTTFKYSREQLKDLKLIFGSNNEQMIDHLWNQLYRVMPLGNDESKQNAPGLAMTLQSAIGPKDELEGLLAAQMIGVHNLAMKFLGSANHPEQTFEGINANIERANKLMRTFSAQIETLNRYRGKGQQKVTVEHVTVNQGGQAVIGVVEGTRGDGGNEQK